VRLRFIFFVLAVGGCQLGACPSSAGGACDPRDFNCPKDYACALGAEICTRTCAVDQDCWVKVSDGCRSNALPLMTLPDGGTYSDNGGDGICPETKLMVCLDGYCQREVCVDAGCNYDVYGPSPFKGTRSQGPSQ
jgi:hypothetical protein